MDKLKVGFSRLNITPPEGVSISGYFIERICDGVLDEIEINCLAVQKNDKTVLLITADVLGVYRHYCELCKDAIAKETGVEKDSIFIHATHSHTSINLCLDENIVNQKTISFNTYIIKKFVQVVKLALKDLASAKIGIAVSKVENIAFNRRYLMKDGSLQTNPGVNNPDIVKSSGLVNKTLNVIRFVREDGQNYVLANFGCHPDTIGGTKISGDWPTFTRRTFEKAIENTKCIFFNGCQGDINHINVKPQDGEMNDLIIDFDNVPRGYSQAKHMGNVVAGAIMQVYEKVKYISIDDIKYLQKEVNIPLNKPSPSEIPEARRIMDLHEAGRDSELPYKGMMLTTIVADAKRKIKLENSPDNLKVPIGGLRIGNIGFVCLAGEPFTGIGLGVKKAKGYEVILPVCLVNGYEGYFPMKDSYEEGGYEARSSIFAKGVAEILIKEGKKLLKHLK